MLTIRHSSARLYLALRGTSSLIDPVQACTTSMHAPMRTFQPPSPLDSISRLRTPLSTAAASFHSSPSVCSAASAPRNLRVAHILLAPDQGDLLQDLKGRIERGEATLQDLATQHSACPSRSRGGDLGWISRGQTVAPFEQAAFGASIGELTACETRFGLHLIQVLEER